MSSFTEEIKTELCKQPLKGTANKKAFLFGYLCPDQAFLRGGRPIEIATENKSTYRLLKKLLSGFKVECSDPTEDDDEFKDRFIIDVDERDAIQNLRSVFVVGNKALLDIPDELLKNEEMAIAMIKGAFLRCGSCTLPDEGPLSHTGYHLEFVFEDRNIARNFGEILCEFDILAKLVSRKDNTVVYIKSKEVISDVLALFDANKSLQTLIKVSKNKEENNMANRAANCSASNIDKALMASVKQVQAIELISKTVGLKSLNALLFEVATARLVDVNASAQELANRLGISKSCFNHRMRKIEEIASALADE